MAANAWQVYNSFVEYLGDGTFDMDSDTFNIALFTSATNAATLTNTVYADLTNEVANGNGYTTGGQALTNVTWSRSTGTVTFDCDAAVWTASGGSITARYAVIYKVGTANSITNPLVCVSLLDNTPADVTVTDGGTFTITPSASGIFTLAAA